MPILVQWKWQEKSKTFLVIFHFYDDFSKPNLRCKMERIADKAVYSVQSGVDFRLATKKLIHPRARDNFDTAIPKPVLTWAPSHVELGYLSEILRYANIIDGLDKNQKENLRPFLAAESFEYDVEQQYIDGFCANKKLEKLRDVLFEKRELFCFEKENDEIEFIFRGIELCLEYIDYLGEILKLFLRT